MNLFYMGTLDGYKFILVGSMTSYGWIPRANWDADTGSVLSHAAFEPFRWPMMTNDSSTWVDVKVMVEGNLLLHLELRGYCSDQDMTVQLNYLNDALVMSLKEVLFVPACVVTIFTGWRVGAIPCSRLGGGSMLAATVERWLLLTFHFATLKFG